MIYHIASVEEWEKAKVNGAYRVDSLERDGFIHCSDKEQVAPVADYLFKEKEGLVLLAVDEKQLTSKVIYEDLYDADEDFPHIYGEINLDAVVRVVGFLPGADGFFSFPDELN